MRPFVSSYLQYVRIGVLIGLLLGSAPQAHSTPKLVRCEAINHSRCGAFPAAVRCGNFFANVNDEAIKKNPAVKNVKVGKFNVESFDLDPADFDKVDFRPDPLCGGADDKTKLTRCYYLSSTSSIDSDTGAPGGEALKSEPFVSLQGKTVGRADAAKNPSCVDTKQFPELKDYSAADYAGPSGFCAAPVVCFGEAEPAFAACTPTSAGACPPAESCLKQARAKDSPLVVAASAIKNGPESKVSTKFEYEGSRTLHVAYGNKAIVGRSSAQVKIVNRAKPGAGFCLASASREISGTSEGSASVALFCLLDPVTGDCPANPAQCYADGCAIPSDPDSAKLQDYSSALFREGPKPVGKGAKGDEAV